MELLLGSFTGEGVTRSCCCCELSPSSTSEPLDLQEFAGEGVRWLVSASLIEMGEELLGTVVSCSEIFPFIVGGGGGELCFIIRRLLLLLAAKLCWGRKWAASCWAKL